jgi:hypothetical protein
MNKTEGGLRPGVVQRGITRLGGACALLITLIASALVPVLIVGCKSVPDPITFGAVQLAACIAAENKPALAPYLRLAGEVFIEFSGGEPPTPEAIRAALTNIPAPGLSPSESQLVWLASVGAYSAVYRPGMSELSKDRLRDVLQGIGLALQDGAKCAPSTAQSGKAAKLEAWSLRDVDANVAAAIKKVR